MPNDARYARLRDLLDLCLALEGSLSGLAIADIEERYDVSKRTAIRMLGAVREALGEPAFESESGVDGLKRWRLRRPFAAKLGPWDATELAALEGAAKLARRDGRRAEARALDKARAQIRALLHPSVATHLDPDLEALIEAQGVGMRAGPRPRASLRVVEALRQAILACHKVRLHHRTTERAPARQHTLAPLGFLYGNRHYLVAWSLRRAKPLLFRLSRIARVQELAEPFDPDDLGGFDLRAFAERSFGVFQEEPVDVVWRFHPEVAAEARHFVFHPTQQLETERDGSLLVRFRAGGQREMAWHLFTWGPFVQVLEPASLRKELVTLLRDALAHHRRRGRAAPAAVRTG